MGVHRFNGMTGRIFRFATLLFFSTIIATCAPGGDAASPPDSSETQPTAEPTEPPTEQPSVTPTEVPTGKLLDPCTFIPPDEVEALFGGMIYSDWRVSRWTPSLARESLSDPFSPPPLAPRILYECIFDLLGDQTEGQYHIRFSVEVYADPIEAAAIMDAKVIAYNNAIEEEGLLSGEDFGNLVEEDGLGERAYRYLPPTGIDVPLFGDYPIIYFLSGNYLVDFSLYFWLDAEVNEAYFEKTLEWAQRAILNFPTDITYVMPDQDANLGDDSQPGTKFIEPCELITRAEAQMVVDGPIVAEESSSFWPELVDPEHWIGLDASCDYSEDGQQGLEFNVEFISNNYRLDQLSAGLAEAQIPEVSGIGDRAFGPGPSNRNIIVISGNYVISVILLNRAEDEDQFQTAYELAELILSRLPSQ